MARRRLRRLVTRRRGKGVGTVLSILIVVGMVSSIFVRIAVTRAIAENPPLVRVELLAACLAELRHAPVVGDEP